jgi:hypothetical protein
VRRRCHFRTRFLRNSSSSLALLSNHCAHLHLTSIQTTSTRLYTVSSRLYTVLAFLPPAVSTTTFFAGGCSDVKGRTFGTIVAQKLAGETPTMSRTEEKLSTSCRVLSRCTRARSSSQMGCRQKTVTFWLGCEDWAWKKSVSSVVRVTFLE